MKYIHTFIITVLTFTSSFAQNGINYKALIKDNLGNIVANSSVDMKFKILESDALTNVYEETHSPTTDSNGILIVNIGEGTVVGGNFEDVNWGGDDHYLNVKIDTGSGFVDIGTTQFMTVPYALSAANVTGLETIDEGGGNGWRLVNRNPDNYGNIGGGAIDLSFTSDNTQEYGATGTRAFATGFKTIASATHATAMGNNTRASGIRSTAMGLSSNASGGNSTAMGENTTASGLVSTAMGNNTIASGQNSVAMGGFTEASGDFSFAFGNGSEAQGNNSIAMGDDSFATSDYAVAIGRDAFASGQNSFAVGTNTEASGRLSTAMGFLTIASAYISTAFGRYNISGGSPTNWIGTDPIFEIGNGSSNMNRDNALTVLKNGNVGIGTHTPQELLHLAGGRLRIGNETIEDGGSDILAFSSSLVPTVDGTDRLGGPNRKWLDVYAVNGTIQTSDRREKKNIKSLNYGLVEVLKMQPVSFNWKNKSNPDTKLGLIAQDLQALVPEAVHTHIWEKDDISGALTKKELDRLGVYYSDLVPVLIRAIQEQQTIIQNQKERINQEKTVNGNQEKNYRALLKRVEDLEVKASN